MITSLKQQRSKFAKYLEDACACLNYTIAPEKNLVVVIKSFVPIPIVLCCKLLSYSFLCVMEFRMN